VIVGSVIVGSEMAVANIILRYAFTVGGAYAVGDVSFAVGYAFTVRGAFAVDGMAMRRSVPSAPRTSETPTDEGLAVWPMSGDVTGWLRSRRRLSIAASSKRAMTSCRPQTWWG
jgi:hypothetical protein